MYRLNSITKALSVMLMLAFALSFAGKQHFMLDNLSSFKVHFALAFLLCSTLLLLNRQRAWSVLAATGLVASLASIAPWYLSSDEFAADRNNFAVKVLASNILYRNSEPTRLVALVENERPDILGLTELTPTYLTGLSEIRRRYPYHLEAPAAIGSHGLGLYSQIPLSDAKLVHFGEVKPPAITALLHLGSSDVEIILVHPDSPMTADLAALRNIQLRELAAYIGESGRPTVVLGDLNTALWSPYYREFVSISGLRNARQGRSVAGTWPPLTLLGVPIDHVFSTHNIGLHDFRVLAGIGSDHLPVAAEFSLLDQVEEVGVGQESGASSQSAFDSD